MTFITIILLYENDFVSQSECIIGDFAMQSPLFMFGFGRALKSGSAQVSYLLARSMTIRVQDEWTGKPQSGA